MSLSLPRAAGRAAGAAGAAGSASSLDLGTPPRLCYPLVVFLVRDDDDQGVGQGHDLHPDESVALVNVVHIKDSVCTLPTSILAQYLKQANGQLSCLKVSDPRLPDLSSRVITAHFPATSPWHLPSH